MTIDELKKCLHIFVREGQREEFLKTIKEIKEKLFETRQSLPNLRLYSASVLAAYDGDVDDGPIAVKLIDFAHAYIDVEAEGGSPDDPAFDDNAMTGLDSLASLFVN
jgi:hypothetical protein